MRAFRKAVIFLTITFLSFSVLFSQAGRGTARISGTVKDENKNPVVGAKVVMEHQEEKGVTRDAVTDKKGKWSIIGLGSGLWKVSIVAEGYEPFEQIIFVSQLERNPSIDAVLKKAKHPETVSEEGIEFLEQGNALFSEGKYDEAIDAYKKFLEKNPANFQVRYNIGNCYKEKGEYDKAIEEYNIVIKNIKEKKQELKGDELASKAFTGIGEAYFKKGDFQNARESFMKSLEIFPKDEVLAYNVGEIYFSNDKVDEAIQFFILATQIKPEWSDPYLKLGYAYFNKGDFEKAKENLKKYLELAPNAPNAEEIKKVIQQLEEK
ncbi:MAG: tetratricopeptide repeat protein [Candidatus Aminicenantia bacterium]